ncbi:hypothetical protein SAMN05421762_3766 [Pseudooceanicola nitratireducens]|uniref:Uncharacterized protein n=1 Tax=Pseudooceanicola nitratireducens TaxID=517719 RepID=A0A1I1QSE4_9RHOB|nr:hypothetical protein SAMN05216183_10838 [Pseudooceanicola nitratireducens]SFD25044.1 hypothetical protein SAMN05421762_3766 [Pseudooceanicola nitratireducens]
MTVSLRAVSEQESRKTTIYQDFKWSFGLLLGASTKPCEVKLLGRGRRAWVLGHVQHVFPARCSPCCGLVFYCKRLKPVLPIHWAYLQIAAFYLSTSLMRASWHRPSWGCGCRMGCVHFYSTFGDKHLGQSHMMPAIRSRCPKRYHGEECLVVGLVTGSQLLPSSMKITTVIGMFVGQRDQPVSGLIQCPQLGLLTY